MCVERQQQRTAKQHTYTRTYGLIYRDRDTYTGTHIHISEEYTTAHIQIATNSQIQTHNLYPARWQTTPDQKNKTTRRSYIATHIYRGRDRENT